ncbi:MAG: hypothetical protein M0006_14560 [Magnetospirillum sp.]|nr:hypothetical protein [Magnetospirillum sp.]
MKDIDHNTAVHLITQSLKGPVADVFRKLVPALAKLDRETFYETVMGNGDLLYGCILIFHKKRDAFAHLLVDAENRPIRDEFVRLRCGRSTRDIVSMLVRTHAKRHFHSALGGDPNDPTSRAGRMYHAMNEYLIHEWQIPLVRLYARIPADKLRRMGPAILDIRDAAGLERLVGAPSRSRQPMREKPPLGAIPDLTSMMSVSLRDADQWWDALHDASVRAAIPIPNEREMREMTSAFAAIGDATRETLLRALNLSAGPGAVVLATAYRVMGRSAFAGIFGTPGKEHAITMLARKLERRKVAGSTDLKMLARAVEGALQASSRNSRPTPAA